MGSQERLCSNTNDSLQSSRDLGLCVLDEEDNETLLLHRINSEDIYKKQEGTIISWSDPDNATDLALSFQETTGCSHIWDQICSVQRNLRFHSLNDMQYHSVDNELRELPPVELSTLALIHKTIVGSGLADQLHVTELILRDQAFIRKLIDLFRVCEDLGNIDGLHMIFKIVHGIILLNSTQIFEKIFGDELIMDIIGCLEYDPEVPHVGHRDFLKEHVVFKEAIPIKDPLVLSTIHQNYQIGYLKDVILPRSLDEATVASLNNTIHSNNAMIVSLLKDESTYIQELFAKLKSSTTTEESKKSMVEFLLEFCTLCKSLQMVAQLRIHRELINEGIFDIICDILQSQDKKLVLTGTDILILFLNQDPGLFRSYVARPEGIPLFVLLVKGLLTDFGDDMNCQFLEILRSLLDSYSTLQRDAILDNFYEKHLGQLIDVISSSCLPTGTSQTATNSLCSSGKNGNHSSIKPEILLNICELLTFCVLHHPYRIKSNFLLNNVIDKVLFLTRRREKYIIVAAVRFLRTLISRSDEHLIHHIVKNNLLKPIVDAFVGNGGRYNVLDSAILELFEYIRKCNLKMLLRYIVDTFWNQLVKFEKLPSISSLKVKYDQLLESTEPRTSCAAAMDPGKRTDERALRKGEEGSDQGDSVSSLSNRSRKLCGFPNGPATSSPSVRFGRLVDFDDDEDADEKNKPPPTRKQPPDEDEGVMESLHLKRRLSAKDDPEPKRLQRLRRSTTTTNKQPNNSLVFNTLCSTISRTVFPSKKTASSPKQNTFPSSGHRREKGGPDESRRDVENRSNKEKDDDNDAAAARSSLVVCFSENMQQQPPRREDHDHPLIPPAPKPSSSAEMAVNGS